MPVQQKNEIMTLFGCIVWLFGCRAPSIAIQTKSRLERWTIRSQRSECLCFKRVFLSQDKST